MSLTSRERGNPPPRRKSCTGCIKAKRRCDGAKPACLRCHQRQIVCEYAPQTRTARRKGPPSDIIQPESLGSEVLPDIMTITDLAADEGLSFDLDTIETPMLDNYPLSFTIDPNEMHLIHQSTKLTPPTTAKDFETVTEVISTKLQWAINEIKRAPTTMILETKTPWCHAQLYVNGMPSSMRDAHACCALYLAKNAINGPVILRSIEEHVQKIQDAPPPSTPLESLAQTQALLLCQIIRLFDGDITARASAERHIPMLEESAMNLLAYLKADPEPETAAELSLYPLAPAKAFWSDWIFQESLRRTLLFAFFFIQIYRLVSGQKGLQCDGRLGLCHSWTLSAHLWKAQTPVEFAKAWRDRKHFVVTNAQFGMVLQEAQADDVDSFGKIFISTLLGIQEAEGWFASRGGSLDYP